MNKYAIYSALAAIPLLAVPTVQAKQPAAGSSPGAEHSNAPAGTPAASSDRDFGRDRAEDVGNGKKKGLTKKHHHASNLQTSTETETR